MAYYDPYYQDPYGGYDPYENYQTFDDNPPEPDKDWVDVPKVNRSYVRKINKDVVHKGYEHLESENLYGIDVFVEHIELNEELVTNPETKEKLVDKIVTSIVVFNLPPSELTVSKDGKPNTVLSERATSTVSGKTKTVGTERALSKVSGKNNTVVSERTTRNEGKQNTVLSERSVTTIPTAYPPMEELFQTLLNHLARVAEKAEKEVESEEVDEELPENGETEEEGIGGIQTSNVIQEEGFIEETTKRDKVDLMEGIHVLLLKTGVSLIQKLQMEDIKVTVSRIDVVDLENQINEVVPLGFAFVRFPQNFYQAVLRRGATHSSFSVPLVGEEGEEVGVASLRATLVTVGEGVNIGISGGPGIYKKVNLIDKFTQETVETIFDPPVHPRLAVTLLNLEPPLGLNRTSEEILKMGDGSLCNAPRNGCRWLEMAKETTQRFQSVLSMDSSISVISNPFSPCLNTIDHELDLEWRKLKRHCKEYWREKEEAEDKMKTIFDDLDELLRQDKGEGWDNDVVSETSKPSQEEDRDSKGSKRSDRTTNSKRSTAKPPTI